MSWEQELFAYLDDLEGQAAALYDAERSADLEERSRAEYRQVTLAARLMASLERELVVELAGVGAVHGRLERVASGWCLLRGAGQDWVIRLDAVASVVGASKRAVPEVAWPAVARLGLASALRRLAEVGELCTVHLIDGRRHDGVPARVGADFFEMGTGESPRLVLVAFDRLAAVQSRRT